MRARGNTSRGLLGRLGRAIGAIAIASGIAVIGVAASASADTVVPLHTATSSDNPVSGTGSCSDVADTQTSYWHFILTNQAYGFVSFSLNLGDGSPFLVSSGDFTSDGSGKPSHAYVAVPAGKTLASLQLADSSATVTPTVQGDPPLFNLSHTCAATTPPVDVCNNIDGNQATIPDGLISDGDGGCVTPPPPPTDVCNSIDGNQATIPDGLISDGAGGCVTPPPPPPTDVCNNIDGNQATIPDGLISDGAGGCVTPPPPPPTDVCNNIDGAQATIPSGLISNGTGGCVTPPPPPPTDVCNNIDGAQAIIPTGLVSDNNGGCVTQQVSSEAPVDVCANIDGVQATVPSGYTANGTNCEAVASEAVSPPADITLPVTGSNTASGIAIGLAMVAGGVILTALSRRRAARSNA